MLGHDLLDESGVHEIAVVPDGGALAIVEEQPTLGVRVAHVAAPEPPAASVGPDFVPERHDSPPAEPAEGETLAPRIVAGRPSTPWLARAIERLAAQDPVAAAKLVVGLIPVQRLRHEGEMAYDLTVTELGTVRVTLPSGTSSSLGSGAPSGRGRASNHCA